MKPTAPGTITAMPCMSRQCQIAKNAWLLHIEATHDSYDTIEPLAGLKYNTEHMNRVEISMLDCQRMMRFLASDFSLIKSISSFVCGIKQSGLSVRFKQI
jgi:hypothetical protein